MLRPSGRDGKFIPEVSGIARPARLNRRIDFDGMARQIVNDASDVGGRNLDIARLFVIWSPEDPAGLPLANLVARHFDDAEESRAFGGIRIPVFVRYEAFAPPATAPRPIVLDEAEHNLVVVVGTHHIADRLADDPAWAGWFDDLSAQFKRRGRKDKFVVLSLDSAVLEVASFPGRHAIRAFQWPFDQESVDSRTRLLLLLTNRCGSMILEDASRTASGELKLPAKQKLFISHAKLDGADDAVRIRRRLDETDFGIDPFVDANDLGPGESFTDELEAEIANATLLAIHTDAYGSRPFCRWEILRAKFHRRPIYIVHRLKQGEGRVFPYGGNAPLMVVIDLNDQTIDKILLAAMTMVLRGLVWSRFAKAVVAGKKLANPPLMLARTPELVDLAHIKMRNSESFSMIVYPDPPLSDEERELIPALNLGIEVVSLSELEVMK